jgi:hypothetical protein
MHCWLGTTIHIRTNKSADILSKHGTWRGVWQIMRPFLFALEEENPPIDAIKMLIQQAAC